MDPVSILGTTAAAAQLIDYSTKFVKIAIKLGKATNQIPSDVQEMEAAANDLVESLQQLETHTAGTDNDHRAMCDASRVVAEELLSAVGGIKKDSSGSKWTIPPRAFRTLRGQKDARGFEVKLERLRLQLATHLAITSQ
ncbi:hypothetical protein B0I35DRAFT_480620 [Stachybotrys elegans]|uniref:Fungal N-terminal domain-containing protein n=1 Tax=Stachybotrys elegans TaxID=80388 RepID=A0A8K0WRB7_9HYPO|nr:hypothetical protein B0I35DRAFT_480620 [Stachybotrys elegans]